MVNILNMKLPTLSDLTRSISPLNGFINGKWTIVTHGTLEAVADFDGFGGYSHKSTSLVPDENIEEGSFASYNKITRPSEMTVTLLKSGYPVEIEETLEKLEQLKNSTQTVDIILPYKTYLNYNIKGLNHARTQGDSINLLSVELSLVEIRERETAYSLRKLTYPTIENPGDASKIQVGKQQTQTPARSILSRIIRSFF